MLTDADVPDLHRILSEFWERLYRLAMSSSEDKQGGQSPDDIEPPGSVLEGSSGQLAVPTPQATPDVSPDTQAVLETRAIPQVCPSETATPKMSPITGDCAPFLFLTRQETIISRGAWAIFPGAQPTEQPRSVPRLADRGMTFKG